MINYNLLLNVATVIGAVMIFMFVRLMAGASEQAELFIRSRVSRLDNIMRFSALPLSVLLVWGPQHFKVMIGALLVICVLVSIRLQHVRLLADGLQPRFVYRVSALFLIGSVSFSAFVVAMISRS